MNIASATGIVFANKTVFSIYNFTFTYALTFIHTLVTLAGMGMFRSYGVFEARTELMGKEGVKVRNGSSKRGSALGRSLAPCSCLDAR